MVSNTGRVKSLRRRHLCFTRPNHREVVWVEEERILSPTSNGHGYLIVGLSNERGRFNRYVHRLVAEAFVDNPNGLPVVNHKDYDTHNNNACNLEWVTQKENIAHSAPNRALQHAVRPGESGERYITKRGEKYRVCIKRAAVDRSFKTKEEAISFRNGVLNEINYSV